MVPARGLSEALAGADKSPRGALGAHREAPRPRGVAPTGAFSRGHWAARARSAEPSMGARGPAKAPIFIDPTVHMYRKS